MTNETIGLLISCLAMVVTIISVQMSKKLQILLWQTVGTSLFLLSYVFSGGGIGVILNAIYFIRNVVFMCFENKNGKALFLTAVLFGVSYFVAYGLWAGLSTVSTAEKLWSITPIIGAIFGTLAVMSKSENQFRIWKFGDSGAWLIYNIRIGLGALGGILGEVFNITSLAIGLIRSKKRKDVSSIQNKQG